MVAGVIACLVISTPIVIASGTKPLPLLHPLIADHMVLPRDRPAPIWGWAAAGSTVVVSFGGQEKTTKSGNDGRWIVRLNPMSASTTPRTMTVTVTGADPAARTLTLKVEDVVVGDIWLCSGQSNMEFALKDARDGATDVRNARSPLIRLFTTATATAARPESIPPDGYISWQQVTPATAENFSAVGYYFGRELEAALGVPIGLIHSAWGGTPVESWTSAGTLAASPESAASAESLAGDIDTWRRRYHEDTDTMLADWFVRHDPGSDVNADPRLDDAGWPVLAGVPGRWKARHLSQQGGIVWYRRTVTIPDEWAGKDLALSLGPIDTQDTTWFNGQRVGGALVPWDPRHYTVPGALVHAGVNVIAVRAVSETENGGFSGSPEGMHVALAPIPALPNAASTAASAAGPGPVSLADGWRYRQGPDMQTLGRMPFRLGADPWVPASLFNAKIAPLLPFPIAGVIWYQGEQNTRESEKYGALLTAFVADWRRSTDQPTLPFGVVQLANFGERSAEPWDSGWAEIRNAQRIVAMTVPGVGLASAVDIGDAKNIHPTNKLDVGRRLAGWALSVVYGRGGEWSGPLFKSMTIEGGSARLSFDHIEKGLTIHGERAGGFEVAGEDRHFVRADARIDGATVVVSSPEVPSPVAVRYAWDDDPIVSLFNGDGLPASPFRTDTWPLRKRVEPSRRSPGYIGGLEE